jgi:aryl-alcohol dehydrogenase-like predicted oxidoreductase
LCLSEGIGLTPWGALGGGFLSGKYTRGQRPETPSEGRIAVSPAQVEESWERRNTERNWAIIDVVGKIVEARGVTYSQVALAWVRAQPMVASLILGARTLEQLEDNLGAAELELSAEEMAELNTVSALPELYPYRMIEAYAMRKANP